MLMLTLILCTIADPAAAKFRTLHRQQAETHLDLAFQLVMPEQLDVLRTDLYGEVAFGAFGGYLAIPITRSLEDDIDVSEVGNVELGLLAHYGDEELSIVGHAGFSVETIDITTLEEFLVLGIGGLPRAQDIWASSLPEVSTLRLGLTPRAQVGPVFGQVDLGIDFLMIDGGEDLQSYHLGVGVGIELPFVELTGEVVHVDLIDPDPLFVNADFDVQTVSVSATVTLAIVRPFVSYTTFFDDTDVHVVGTGLSLVFD